MRALIPCCACGRHVFSDEVQCPFCKATMKRGVPPAAWVGGAMMVAAACGGTLDNGPSDAAAIGVEDGSMVAESGGEERAVADAAGADSATHDGAAADGSAFLVDAPFADASDAADGNSADAPPCCLPVYKSPPRRSVWG